MCDKIKLELTEQELKDLSAAAVYGEKEIQKERDSWFPETEPYRQCDQELSRMRALQKKIAIAQAGRNGRS
jgi:hypothetical protein